MLVDRSDSPEPPPSRSLPLLLSRLMSLPSVTEMRERETGGEGETGDWLIESLGLLLQRKTARWCTTERERLFEILSIQGHKNYNMETLESYYDIDLLTERKRVRARERRPRPGQLRRFRRAENDNTKDEELAEFTISLSTFHNGFAFAIPYIREASNCSPPRKIPS